MCLELSATPPRPRRDGNQYESTVESKRHPVDGLSLGCEEGCVEGCTVGRHSGSLLGSLCGCPDECDVNMVEVITDVIKNLYLSGRFMGSAGECLAAM